MVLQSLWHTMLKAFLDNPFAVLFGILAQPFSRILPYLHLILGLYNFRVIGGDIHRTETNYFFFQSISKDWNICGISQMRYYLPA
jgi:hypothetical protein